MNADAIMTRIEEVLQSHESLAVDDSFEIGIGVIHIPSGSGRPRVQVTNLHGKRKNSLTSKRSIVQIVNSDKLCLARSIAVGLGNLKWRQGEKTASEYTLLKDHRRPRQKYEALSLHQKAGVPTDRPCTLQDVAAFEKVLNDVQIVVFRADQGNKVMQPNVERAKQIYIYHVPPEDGDGPGHFHAIVNPAGFLGSSYFCQKCLRSYSNKKRHQCDNTCKKCKTLNCPAGEEIQCTDCNVTCQSRECFQRHQKVQYHKKGKSKGRVKSPSVCSTYWQCLECKRHLNRTIRSPKEHNCDEWHCSCCQQYVCDVNHRCYLRYVSPKESSDNFIFFDAECRMDNSEEEGTSVHIPNLFVAHISCSSCLEYEDTHCPHCGDRCPACSQWDTENHQYAKAPCDGCGSREVTFQGDGCQHQFGSWLFQPCHAGYCVVAHNMKGYDGYFLLDHLIKNGIKHRIIFNGSKIMSVTVQNRLSMRVIDSLNFLPMKLAKLPEAFGLTTEKGDFPHFFNTKTNQTYVGPYPDPEFYGIDYMSANDRASFLQWYKEQEGKVFDFQAEILKYCRADVQILRQACLKFRQLLLTATTTQCGVDPFTYLTIASVCMAIYRAKFICEEYEVTVYDGSTYPGVMKDGQLAVMKDGQWISAQDLDIINSTFIKSPIGQVPAAGYVKHENFSKESIQWLEWLMHVKCQKGNPIHIQHALNGGEYHVPGTAYRADGFCKETNTIFEFYGCLYHGCPECYVDRDIQHPRTKDPVSVLYVKTAKREQVLKRMGYKLVTCWEHEFHKQPQMQSFLDSLDIQDRLRPRDSFFGGRTNAARLHYKAGDGEKIKYVDFTSLYPSVNAYARYPVGHPDIIVDNFQPISKYFGIAKVKVLPPRGLYHPVLPYLSEGKLKFPLCRTCADREQTEPCTCSDDQRAIIGTWCTPELLKAIEKGYSIQKIYEVYHWPETTQYDQEKKEGGLFSEYIRTFLKIKQEASGWPAWCQTTEDKERYVNDYENHEGIRLENIRKNPGLRQLAKLCLNSFWGKFGQRENLKQSEYLYEPEELYRYIADTTKDIQDFHVINQDTVQLEWKHEEEFIPDDLRTNVFMATFTTCWARLKLYDLLDKLGDRVLYYDTDAVIYISRPGEYDPPLGDYLGELTDELCGDWIVEYVSGGPKNYAYRTNREGTEVCKVRGFTLNYANSKLINFESIRELVLSGEAKTIMVTNPSKICRRKRNQSIISQEERKDYRVVYTKRVIQPDLNTLPYGY